MALNVRAIRNAWISSKYGDGGFRVFVEAPPIPHEYMNMYTCLSRPPTQSVLDLHLILDNYGTHKHPNVRAWLATHSCFKLHFTPTGASWLNLVECWFSQLTQKRIRRGVFRSVAELIAAIDDYMKHYNDHPTPFVWTATVDALLRKVAKCKVILETLH